VATVEDCERALHELADRINGSGPHEHRFTRSLSCSLPDLGAMFTGQLNEGRLVDIARAPDEQAEDERADIRLSMASDDLVELVAGRLNLASAWASGRVRINAGVMDMMRLRSLF
jgi:hypothetical protein